MRKGASRVRDWGSDEEGAEGFRENFPHDRSVGFDLEVLQNLGGCSKGAAICYQRCIFLFFFGLCLSIFYISFGANVY